VNKILGSWQNKKPRLDYVLISKNQPALKVEKRDTERPIFAGIARRLS